MFRRIVGLLLALALIVILPAAIHGSSGMRRVARREMRHTELSGTDAIRDMVETFRKRPKLAERWNARVDAVKARGYTPKGLIHASHTTVVTVYEPTITERVSFFLRSTFDGTVHANAPNCDDYPDLCDYYDGGGWYDDTYDESFNTEGYYGAGYADTQAGEMDGDGDVSVSTDPNDPYNFDTMDVQTNNSFFAPSCYPVGNYKTYKGIPCPDTNDIMRRMLIDAFENAGIGAVAAAAAAAAASVGTGPLDPAIALGTGIFTGIATIDASLTTYLAEYGLICVFGWMGSTEPVPTSTQPYIPAAHEPLAVAERVVLYARRPALR